MNGFEYTGIAVMIFVAGVMFPYLLRKLSDAVVYAVHALAKWKGTNS